MALKYLFFCTTPSPPWTREKEERIYIVKILFTRFCSIIPLNNVVDEDQDTRAIFPVSTAQNNYHNTPLVRMKDLGLPDKLQF